MSAPSFAQTSGVPYKNLLMAFNLGGGVSGHLEGARQGPLTWQKRFVSAHSSSNTYAWAKAAYLRSLREVA